jgi:hypothetical protein
MTAPPDCEPLWHADEDDWDIEPPDPRITTYADKASPPCSCTPSPT